MVSQNWLVFCAFISFVFVCTCNGGMLGGRESVSTNSKEVEEAAQFTETELNKMSNNMYYMKKTEILKAEKQMVRGVIYYLTLEIASTECKKNLKTEDEIEECKVSEKEDASLVEECTVEVYYDIPPTPPKLQNVKCVPVQKKPDIKQYKKHEKLKIN